MTENEQQLQKLIIAVVKLEKTQEATVKAQDNTTKNVDKLIGHMDNMLPFHEQLKAINVRVVSLEEESKLGIRPQTLKNLLAWGAIIIIAFGSWIEINHNTLKNNFNTHEATQKEKEINIEEDLKKQDSLLSRNFERIKASERYK